MAKRAKKAVLRKCAKADLPKKANCADSMLSGAADSSIDKAEAEAKRQFDEWRAKYEPVAREIYAKRSKRAESKRRRAIERRRAFGDLCEMTDGLASFCRKNNVSLEEGEKILNEWRPGPYAAVFIIVFFEIAWFGAVFLRKELTRRIDRAKHEAARPYYYEQERIRRQTLAEERRRIRRRRTLNACPTREEIVDAWKKVKDSNEDLLRFGSLMEDLECYVDNSLVRDDSGAIIGRRSGIKGWLQVEIPALYTVYSRVMAYKAAAKRMRQLIELQDPMPLSAILDMGNGENLVTTAKQDYGADEILNEAASGGNDGVKRENGDAKSGEVNEGVGADGVRGVDDVALLRARAIYLEVVKPVGGGTRKRTALIERMLKLTDPNFIDDCNMLAAWKAKYERKITVRTKSAWMKRLVKMMA